MCDSDGLPVYVKYHCFVDEGYQSHNLVLDGYFQLFSVGDTLNSLAADMHEAAEYGPETAALVTRNSRRDRCEYSTAVGDRALNGESASVSPSAGRCLCYARMPSGLYRAELRT
jgi:hypothetical protein